MNRDRRPPTNNHMNNRRIGLPAVGLIFLFVTWLLITNDNFADYAGRLSNALNGGDAEAAAEITADEAGDLAEGAEGRVTIPDISWPTGDEVVDLVPDPFDPPDETTPDPTDGDGPSETGGPGLAELPDDDRAAAAAVISSVRTAEAGSGDGYEREAFGQSWTDDNTSGTYDHNGCDTRNDILRRDLVDVVARIGTEECVIVAGTLLDDYTGEVIYFVKERADEVHVDHVVSLSAGWSMGASRWDEATRTAFANDPLNLVATDGPTNLAKGDSSPSSWLPPQASEACPYALRYAQVSLRYDLPVTTADRDAMAEACR